jgi:hypothetical protein
MYEYEYVVRGPWSVHTYEYEVHAHVCTANSIFYCTWCDTTDRRWHTDYVLVLFFRVDYGMVHLHLFWIAHWVFSMALLATI